jgi:opacity protein-like surface antigen
MKRIIIGIIVVAMVLVASGAAFADDTAFSVGIKGWLNSWTRTFSSGSSVDSDAQILMLGPSVNVKFSNGAFLGGSYLISSADYEFTSGSDVDKISRKDLDLIAGYMFTPRIGLFIGYKSIEASVSYENKVTGVTVSDYATFDMTGPGIGVLGNIPLNDMLALYGNIGYMSLKYSEDFGISYTEDEPGYSFEIGLAAAFNPNLSGNIGYKLQKFTGSDSDITDSFSGLTLGLNYTF